MFGQVPKVNWETKVSTDRKNRITLGLNCLLVQLGEKNILVDCGTGSKELDNEKETYGLVPSRLVKGLRSLGISPKEIDAVILTGLHFDHSGGCTKLDRVGSLVPTSHAPSITCRESAGKTRAVPTRDSRIRTAQRISVRSRTRDS